MLLLPGHIMKDCWKAARSCLFAIFEEKKEYAAIFYIGWGHGGSAYLK